MGSKQTELGEEVGINEAAVDSAGSVFFGGLDAFFMVQTKKQDGGKSGGKLHKRPRAAITKAERRVRYTGTPGLNRAGISQAYRMKGLNILSEFYTTIKTKDVCVFVCHVYAGHLPIDGSASYFTQS